MMLRTSPFFGRRSPETFELVLWQGALGELVFGRALWAQGLKATDSHPGLAFINV
jgi:hypothetical protein